MAQRPALVVDRGGVVGRVHEIVEIRDAGARHGHQGNGDLAVVDAGRGQHAGDRDLAAGHVDVEFVPGPGLFVALAVFLAADVAGGGQVGEHLAEVLRDLPLETRSVLASAAVRPCADVRACAAAGDDRAPGFVLGRRWPSSQPASRALRSRWRRAIAPMMRPPSARSISAAWILSGSSPCANSANARGKRGLGRNLRASLPAEDATQRLVDGEALDQGAGGGNAQDRLGHESSGEGATVFGRPTRPPGRVGHEGFETDHVERGDETTQRFGDRIVNSRIQR